MSAVILSKSFEFSSVCEKEALRYAGCRTADEDVTALLHDCINEIEGRLIGRVCWCELPVSVDEDICDFGVFRVNSANLAANLHGCSRAILFAATIGVEMDRLIARYSSISPSKALMMQALGAERIENLCDIFCLNIEKEYVAATKPRFSPGYGDLPLETQKDIFSILDCSRRIGLSINKSLLMTPSKSVTAFVGLTDKV